MEETPVGVIKRTWGVMEETHPMRESSSTETQSPRPRHVSPAAMSQAGQGWTGEAVSKYPESPVPYTGPARGAAGLGKHEWARTGTDTLAAVTVQTHTNGVQRLAHAHTCAQGWSTPSSPKSLGCRV